MEFHKLYEAQYDMLAESIDEIAERIRTIGHFAEGRLKEILKLTTLDEPEAPTAQEQQIQNLEADHETMIMKLRKLIKDLMKSIKILEQ
jgi:starvation-inducible DNA-binding protein